MSGPTCRAASLVLSLAGALRDVFPAIGFSAVAARWVGDHVEVAADDAAARRAHRLTVAGGR